MFRKQAEVIPEDDISIWSCTSEDCNGWMRNDFTFENQPLCPLCSSQMSTEIKRLPILQNHVR